MQFEIPEEMRLAAAAEARRQSRFPRFGKWVKGDRLRLTAPEVEAMQIMAAYAQHQLARTDEPLDPMIMAYLDAAVIALGGDFEATGAAVVAIADERASAHRDEYAPLRHAHLSSAFRCVSALAELIRLGRSTIDQEHPHNGTTLNDALDGANRDLQA